MLCACAFGIEQSALIKMFTMFLLTTLWNRGKKQDVSTDTELLMNAARLNGLINDCITCVIVSMPTAA